METLQYLIPAILILAITTFLIYKFFREESERRKLEFQKQNLQLVTPTRLRAYERLTMLLERINPNNLVVRNIEGDENCLELQTKLLQAIRKEFDYNLSMQIYVSETLWNEIIEARDNIIQLINAASAQCQPNEQATRLANIIVEAFNVPEETAIDAALRSLRDEINKLF